MLMISRIGLSTLQLSLFICMFSSSASGSSSASSSFDQPSEVTMEQIGATTFTASTNDAPDETPNPSKWTSPTFYSDLSAFNVTHFSSGRHNLEVVAGVTPDAENA